MLDFLKNTCQVSGDEDGFEMNINEVQTSEYFIVPKETKFTTELAPWIHMVG